MYIIKTINKIAQPGLDELDAALFAIDNDSENPDAILVRSADMHEYEINPELLCIARAGAGTNNIPVGRCSEAGIPVFNSPGANSGAVCELVIAALIMSARDVAGGLEWVWGLAGQDDVAAKIEKGKSAFAGPEIYGKTLGVAGLGAVGAKVANAMHAFGMKVYGYDPFLSVDAAWRLSSDIRHVTELDAIFRECDYITLHMPLTDETRGFINAQSIAKMKDGVRIINLARGELVNDEDILDALATRKVARYVTDFPNEKLIGVRNVVALPHIGASTPESEDNCAIMAAGEMAEYVLNGNIRNSVNMPSVFVERAGCPRLTAFNRNIPNMINAMTSVLSAASLNIENLTNKSRGDYAYTIIDIKEAASDEVLEQLRGIEGVLRVRQII